MMSQHIKYMSRAIELAKKAQYNNPCNLLVGCVIVKNNKIIGEGYYDASVSKDHAETKAFNSLSEDAAGSSLYVTLEPCFHTGKTPPCVDNVIAHKVKEVIIPFQDPNILVKGKSIHKLQRAGITVTQGVLAEECYNLNEEFLYYHITSKPLVTAKWASSLDGKLTTYAGNSKWISSEEARKCAHMIRGKNKGILIGANTLRVDNPSLDVRYDLKGYPNPIRIVLSHNSEIDVKSKLWHDDRSATWLIIPEQYVNDNSIKQLQKQHVEIISLPIDSNGMMDFDMILTTLGRKGLSSLMIEGGPNVLSNVLESRLANKLEVFITPYIIGGNFTAANFINESFKYVHDAEKFKICHHQILENDTIWLSLMNIKYLHDKMIFMERLQQ